MAKIAKSTDSSSLAEVVDRILGKGIVIDAWAKGSHPAALTPQFPEHPRRRQRESCQGILAGGLLQGAQ